MSTIKKLVTDYLKIDRTLIGGRNLYNKLPGKSLALQASFSRMTNTPANVEKICYELAKLAGIDQRGLKILTQKPVDKAAKIEVVAETVVPPNEPDTLDKLLQFNPEETKYPVARALAKELELKLPNQKGETIFLALTEARKAEITKQVSDLPKKVKASIRLREQFPFLREKDCPDSLKLLVSDMITSYEDFVANQPKLHESVKKKHSAERA
ncbi:MAG: hypothetical protein AAFO99_15815 [Bacteroidota bacterium]